MKTSSNRDEMVAHLRLMSRLAAVYDGSPAARCIWQKDHRLQQGEYPRSWVSLGDGMTDIEGLIVGGDWSADQGWDLDGDIIVLTEDGDLLTVHSWMSTDAEIIEAPCPPGEWPR